MLKVIIKGILEALALAAIIVVIAGVFMIGMLKAKCDWADEVSHSLSPEPTVLTEEILTENIIVETIEVEGIEVKGIEVR